MILNSWGMYPQVKHFTYLLDSKLGTTLHEDKTFTPFGNGLLKQ
jgi:hypothetical protein